LNFNKIKFIDCLKCIINRNNISKNSNNKQKNIRDSSNTIYLRESHAILNKIETGRSSPYSHRNQNKSNNNENTIEIARGSFTLPFEKQEDFQYMSEPNNIDENQRANLGLESNTGDNCCTEFNKICLLF